jgi:YD repeat-containing protein
VLQFGASATGPCESQVRPEYFDYDPAGNLESEVNAAGMPTYYAYDALDRMTERSSTNDAPSYFAYYALSRMRGGPPARAAPPTTPTPPARRSGHRGRTIA